MADKPTNRQTVLLVDDESAITDALAPYLERSGFSVAVAHDGAEGLDVHDEINPDIVVTQNFQANNITSLRARLVKGDIPDLITINGDYNYGALTRTSIFYDFGRTALLDGVNPAFASILNTLGQGGEGQTNGLAFADNGSGIIYNKDIFAEAGLEPPTTWNELIGICDELTGRGINPFYWATKDNWTGAPRGEPALLRSPY